MKKTSQIPTIAEFHRKKQYQLMYGVTNDKGTAGFHLTKRNFSLNAGPAPVYKALVAIIKKYTFSLLGFKNQADATTEIKRIQDTINKALNLPKTLVGASLTDFASTQASSQSVLENIKNTPPQNIKVFIKNSERIITRLDKIGKINAKKFRMNAEEYQKYVNSAVGSVGDNIAEFKKLLGTETLEEIQSAQIYVTTILRTKIGTLNEILTAQLFQSVAQLGTVTLAGTNKSIIQLPKLRVGFQQTSKGDFYYEKDNKLIFSSVKWTAKSAKKGILKAADSLSLLRLKNSAFSQFMVDIVNLRLSTLTSSSKNNKFIAALLADLAFLGYSGRPLFIVSTSYEKNKPKITVNFMYEIFENYIDKKLYPSTTKIDFKYSYHSLKKKADFGYSGKNGPHGFEFYDNVPYRRTKNLEGNGAYMTKDYFDARVKSAAFTVKGKFKY